MIYDTCVSIRRSVAPYVANTGTVCYVLFIFVPVGAPVAVGTSAAPSCALRGLASQARCDPPAGARREASPAQMPTGTPRTPPRLRPPSAAARRSAEAWTRGQKPVLVPPAKQQNRCSCAMCSSCRSRVVRNTISVKIRRSAQLIRTPLSNIDRSCITRWESGRRT